jgi:hypothetical protein
MRFAYVDDDVEPMRSRPREISSRLL